MYLNVDQNLLIKSSSRIHSLNEMPLNPNLTSIEEEVEEVIELNALKNCEENFDYTEFQASANRAIASYLENLTKENVQQLPTIDNLPIEIESLTSLQEKLKSVLAKAFWHQRQVKVVHSNSKKTTCCHVIPPFLQKQTQQIDHLRERIIQQRQMVAPYQPVQQVTHHQVVKHNDATISIYDARHTQFLPGQFAFSNKKFKKLKDTTAMAAYKAAQDVHEFWLKNYGLNSFDGNGHEIKSTVHYGKHYDNAFWNGQQMVYGDGNKHFSDFTELSVVAHEFGHAVTGDKLNYEGESGALNEHLSDVWGSLTLQYKKNQTVDQASWLIGEGVVKSGKQTFPLRSMKDPGNAYNTLEIGKDPQPAHYSQLYKGEEDLGGVHINSGIPNKAFYLFAKNQGGYAWEKSGLLWLLTLKADKLIQPNCTMQQFAQATLYTAVNYFPTDYKMHQDLISAWQTVGVI